MTDTPRARPSTYAGLFFVTLATLLHELLLTRIFSVTMWYHFAFMAVSVAMFGMTVGAVIVYLRPTRYTAESVSADLAQSACLFSVSLVVSFLTHLSIPFEPQRTLVGVWSVAITYAVIALPFVFSGIAVCLALSRFPAQVHRLYAVDLLGAALACLVFVVLLRAADGPSAVVAAASLAALGGLCFARDTPARRWRFAAGLLFVCFGAWAAFGARRSAEQEPLVRLVHVKGAIESKPRWEKWNCFSRVAVFGSEKDASPPFGWGLSETYPRSATKHQLGLNIDASAATVMTGFDGGLEEIDHLQYDVTNLAHFLRPNAKVLVVGTGGGRDVLAAISFHQPRIVGLEINDNILGAVNETFGDFTGHLDRRNDVRFVNDEARSWIARSNERFDIIQVSLIDTWAATAAGAFVFTENSLYTLEAWKLFLSRLEPRGVLSFSRWYFPDRPGEIYRLATLANAALRSIGVQDTRRHILVVTHVAGGIPSEGGAAGVGTMIVSREPFDEKDLDVIDRTTARLNFDLALSARASMDPLLEEFATSRNLREAVGRYELDVSPPTDDRPFFFHMLRLRDAFRRDLWRQGVMSFNTKAVFLLFTLLAVVGALTLSCILVPLFLTTRREDLAGATPLFLYFGAIGVGFMLLEISQMQRLVVFLGHPVYGFSVVLFSLLLSSGLGSFSTQLGRGRGAFARLLLLVAAAVAFGLVTPHAIARFSDGTTPLRLAVACGLLMPLGFFLGMAFPLGMRLAAGEHPALTPWLWGINGATSVCASVLALAISLAFSITVSFWSGLACYLVACTAFAWAQASRAPRPAQARAAAIARVTPA